MTDTQFIAIGKIIGAHGIKGNLRVHSYAESPSLFETGRLIRVRNSSGGEKNYQVKWAKPHSKGILLAFEDVVNRTLAEALVGAELLIDRRILPELEAGTYYWSDLIGLSVFSKDGNFIGCIKAIMPTGSNDVYVVASGVEGGPKEVLIPALESVVLEVDLEKGEMHVDLPEGL